MEKAFLQTDLFDLDEEPLRDKAPSILKSNAPNGSVTFHFEKRLKKGIRFLWKRQENAYELFLPAYMETEDFSSVRELALECCRLSFQKKKESRERYRLLLSQVWNETERILADRGEKFFASRTPPIRPVGKFYDLEKVLAEVNQNYFQGRLAARITWSNRKGGLSYHRKLQDPATGENFHLISISRGYDFPNCPPYAVAGVVYHECLHIVNPPIVKNGRRIVHGKDFKMAERRYREYEKWMKWHAEVLPKNVRAMNRPARRWLFGLGKK